MSANDILDVLNVQRDEERQPVKKKKKVSEQPSARQSGMARELYNLIGPNTPPIHLSNPSQNSAKDRFKVRTTPWSRIEFSPISENSDRPQVKFKHWVRGSKQLLEQELQGKPYAFEKYNINLDLPKLVDEATYNKFMEDFEEEDRKAEQERKDKEINEKNDEIKDSEEQKTAGDQESSKSLNDLKTNELSGKDSSPSDQVSQDKEESKNEADSVKELDTERGAKDLLGDNHDSENGKSTTWSYNDTKQLFELCLAFDLKWPIVYDRFVSSIARTLEDLKGHYYRLCARILESQPNYNASLVESLKSYSVSKDKERKQYLERLLKRTPAEIAEEESLVIEARRFELAAKKMLMERSHLLTLLDSPQSSQSIQQYQSSQGLTNLYNNLMIIDKHQKKRQLQQLHKSTVNDPVPPPIPIAASSSFKKERNFHTPLQQHLASVLKNGQVPSVKLEPNAIQQMLMKRLTVKEEEAYGLHYHVNEKMTPGVVLRSTQKLPALQQRLSVLKSLNNVLQELDIPKAGGNTWRPVMPTRKTMSKYDELLRSVVTLLDIKRGKDRLESEIQLIKSQRGLQ
ncbi:uncharacterized protein PRCAT00004845001 [Priceomyces carsonii]|uniref:uncharacterized protein n=1 Tax=Priceomyces carsonii TaxID=28549 RepID=UPI002ED89C93|nr:unnamed protein product [Priceomyces carsonii]